MLLRDRVRRELSLHTSGRPFHPRLSLLALVGALAFAASLPAFPAQALSWHQELVRELSSFDVGTAGNAELADIDGDGDLDLVAGEGGSGRLALFANVGSSASPAFVQVTGSADPFRAIVVGSDPDLADLDGDGDLDLLVGNGAGQLAYFANSGSPEIPFFVQRTGSANPFAGIDVGSVASPELVDLDADGDLDAVIGENNARLFYFANTGSAITPSFVARTGSASPFFFVTVNYFYNLDPVMADMDGDGDLDMLVGEHYGRLRLARNTGSSSAPAFVGFFDGPLALVDVAQNSSGSFGDLDGDADLDLVVTDNGGSFFLFENTAGSAAPAFVERSASESPFGSSRFPDFTSPETVDFDGDGDLDALFGRGFGVVSFAVNTGSAAAPAFDGILFDPFGIDVGYDASPALADLDADGDLDLLLGSRDGLLRLYENTGGPGSFAFLELVGSANPFLGIDVGSYSGPDLMDLDADGDFDAVTGRAAGGLRYFENTGSSSAPSFILLTGSGSPFAGITLPFTDPSLADLDDDGDLDLLLDRFFYENTGTPAAPAFVERTGEANPLTAAFGDLYSVEPADLDGDGDFDLLGSDAYGRVIFLRANSTEIFADGFEDGDSSAWSASFGEL
jgi:hypothetical protein